MKKVKRDVFEDDIKMLDELMPNNDSFEDKLHVALGILKEYEELGPEVMILEERKRRDIW